MTALVNEIQALDATMGDLRKRIVQMLEQRNILEAEDVERGLAGGAVVHPMRDERQEGTMRARLSEVVRGEPADTPPRLGTLLALADASNLLGAAFDPGDRDRALDRAKWVFDRDAIVRGVREEVSKAEGTWS